MSPINSLDNNDNIDFTDVTYPKAPWNMIGFSYQSFSIVDVAEARKYVPEKVKIIEVWPGKTLGGVYLSKYNEKSTLQYYELAIICAITQYNGKVGLWMSQVYVDSISSLKSGPEMWGWPKQYADFNFDGKNNQKLIEVRQNNKSIMKLDFKDSFFYLNLPTYIPTFGSIDNEIVWFRGKGKMNMGICSSHIYIPESCEFSHLKLQKKLVSVHSKEINMTFGNIKNLDI